MASFDIHGTYIIYSAHGVVLEDNISGLFSNRFWLNLAACWLIVGFGLARAVLNMLNSLFIYLQIFFSSALGYTQ